MRIAFLPCLVVSDCIFESGLVLGGEEDSGF